MILPAWVEHQPRRLLRAVAAGVPVITTDACGLEGVPGVITVPTGDVEALRKAIRSVFDLEESCKVASLNPMSAGIA